MKVTPGRIAATGALACFGLLAGCSSSHPPSALAPTMTTPAERAASIKTAPEGEFCRRLGDLVTATAEVGIVTDLAEVRSRLAHASVLADQVTVGGAPAGSGTFRTLLSLDSDLQAVDAWVQKDATQSDLNSNDQPPDVRARFTDMGVQFRALSDWSSANCQAYGAGDG